METGACIDGPARDRPLSVYAIQVEGDDVLVSLEAPAAAREKITG
jgi:nitrite reductase/ring-hydroxylating ferredoxin subunit